jgi:hypothetical protein
VWFVSFWSQLSNKNIDLIHLQHIWNPYIQVMAFGQEKKDSLHYPRGMLEPWIMERNPLKKKKIAMFLYQESLSKGGHITLLPKLKQDI